MQVHFSDASKLKTDTSEQGKARRQVYAQVCCLYNYEQDFHRLEKYLNMKDFGKKSLKFYIALKSAGELL